MNETTELIVLPPPESVRTVFTTPQGLDPYLQQIRTQLDAFEADVSTKKGRDASSLPHRQLRKCSAPQEKCSTRSLPHRQLRKWPEQLGPYSPSSLPHRQLRNTSH